MNKYIASFYSSGVYSTRMIEASSKEEARKKVESTYNVSDVLVEKLEVEVDTKRFLVE